MLKKENILIVDDDIQILELLQRHLKSMDYHTYMAVSVKEALYILKDTAIDLLITDLNMPEIDGMQLIKYVSEHHSDMPKLVVTGFPSVDSALGAIKSGVADYLIKPFTKIELQEAVQKSLSVPIKKSAVSKKEPAVSASYGEMIGASEAFKEVTQIIDRVKDNHATVLIRGENGTGKELVARAIHYSGKLARKPFITVNCGAIPEHLLEAELFGYIKGAFTGANENRDGFFQAAHTGTIFLDEIGNASLSVQMKLLRVLQEKEVTKVGARKAEKLDVRIVAATNSNLEDHIENKTFREDLFYRLSVVTILVPPLRERKSDISLLVDKFLKKYGIEYKDKFVGISPEAMEVLQRYHWPGNIRELENIIQRAVIMSDKEITLKEMPEQLKFKIELQDNELLPLKEIEKRYIRKVLLATDNNKTKAAEVLGIDRKTLRNKLE